MNFENLGDKIIDDQGNVKSFAGGADARLYYLDIAGNRKKYLLEGEGEGGANVSYIEVNNLAFQENTYYTCTTTLTNISTTLGPIKNTMCIFTTGDTIDYNFNFIDGMKLNKPIELEPNKTYVIAIDNYLIAWSEFISAK